MKANHRATLLSLYEFSDHVRMAVQIGDLVNTLQPKPNWTLYLRDDCREFMTDTAADCVRFRSKYLMTAQLFFEAVLLRRKVLLTTGPEASATPLKMIFAGLMKLFRKRISMFVIVRDFKEARGRFLLPKALYSSRSVVAVESDALLQSARGAGYTPGGYLYPSPITRPMSNVQRQVARGIPGAAPFTILLTGSLDEARRDYGVFLDALAALTGAGVTARVVVGGHCMTPSASALLDKLERGSHSVVAKSLLTDAELDAALGEADAIVCLNRPAFYGDIKGSGAIGDSFFAGKRLLIDARLVSRDSEDSRFYVPFVSVSDLRDHLLRAYSEPDYLCIDAEILDSQARYFSGLVKNWLAL